MEQVILSSDNNYIELKDFLKINNCKNVFVVCTDSIGYLKIDKFFKDISSNYCITYFDNFKPNPEYESVVEGIKKYKESNSNIIIAVGGGSAMDVAKCIKLFSNLNPNENYLNQTIIPNDIKLMAIPTTAGTGSEATKYAVIYYNNEKQSIADDSIIPQYVLFDHSALITLPEYQKKSTMLDALSHSIESYWSINSNKESKKYSIEAIKLILDNYKGYMNCDEEACKNMLKAANIAGKAINITQTTAGHAMCYKLTSLYGIAHGHAAGLVNSELFPYMIRHSDKCSDIRGKEFVDKTFSELKQVLGEEDFLRKILQKLELYNVAVKDEDIDVLVSSVNTTRLKNNPVLLDKEDITIVYRNIFDKLKKGCK